jgi:hypothetical protein
MSPIGRVFIVLNLVLAGGFLVVSGTHLQQQHNYKSKLAEEQKARTDDAAKFGQQITTLTGERNTFENAKTANESAKQNLENTNAQLMDENKRLSALNSEFEGQLKAQSQYMSTMSAEIKTAFGQSKSAFDTAIADQKTRDESVRAKDAAEAENRDLKNTVAQKDELLKSKDLEIAGLSKQRSELELLVKVAEQNGFKPSMAAPNLAGLVTTANDRLCTIQITDNPGNVDIGAQIERGSWGFAIYDASGYKGEAIATKFEPSANAVLCNVRLVKGAIKEGDRAATKTP